MLACQLMAVAISAVRRFDSLALHLWSSTRQLLSSLRFWKAGGEAEF